MGAASDKFDRLLLTVIGLSVVSYNKKKKLMHGYNQGSCTVKNLLVICTKLDVFYILQEHWLISANLSKFEGDFPQYNYAFQLIGNEFMC